MRDYVHRVFARNELKIAIVGDIDAAAAGKLIDKAFGSLPAKNDLRPVPAIDLHGLGRQIVTKVAVPQTVVTFSRRSPVPRFQDVSRRRSQPTGRVESE